MDELDAEAAGAGAEEASISKNRVGEVEVDVDWPGGSAAVADDDDAMGEATRERIRAATREVAVLALGRRGANAELPWLVKLL